MRSIRLYDGALVIVLVLSLLFAWMDSAGKKKQVEAFNEAMGSWINKTPSQLFVQWGPPTETYDDGGGGTVLVYREDREHQTGGYTNTQVNPYTGDVTIRFIPVRVQEWKVWRAFWVNRSGRIYHWAWQGL